MPPRPVFTATVTGPHLLITADAEAIEWATEQLERGRADEDILWDGFEGYWDNGSFYPFDASDGNPFVGFTEAPCIAEDMVVLEDGTREINGRVWWFPNYAVRSFMDDLIANGRVVFTFGFDTNEERNDALDQQ